MTRARTFLAICALALPIPLAVAGCGGDDAADVDPREVLERTFEGGTDVTSGVVDLSFDVSATGEQEGSFAAEVSGPFQGDAADQGALPQLDLSASVTGEGGGEEVDFEGRVVITQESAFVEYEDETYEVGARDFARLKEGFESQVGEADEDDAGASVREACEQAIEQAGGDPSACDIDVVGDWMTNLENQGTEDVEGTETIHVSGDLNVERFLDDVGDLAASIPGVGLQGFQPSQFAAAIPEANFDLYSGTEDDQLRRLDIDLTIDPSAVTAGVAVVPIERIDLDFSLTLSELNEPQTIDTPSGPTRPIEDLLGDDPFDLGRGLGGFGPGARGGGDDELPDFGDGPGTEGGAEVDPDQAQDYLDCIADAAGDPDAINACAEQL